MVETYEGAVGMSAEAAFAITYWGVTGTIPAPLRPDEVTEKIVHAIHQLAEYGQLSNLPAGTASLTEIRRRVEQYVPFHLRSTYGGDTTCVEVQTPDALLVLDSGSGFRQLGSALMRRWNAPGFTGPRAAHVLITHPHLDHTHAIPFADCYFDPRNEFTLHATAVVQESLRQVLEPGRPLSHTYFPPDFDLLKAIRRFHTIQAGQEFVIGSTHISTYALQHPGGCLAFRLENAARAFVFATDHEHPEVPDRGLAEFARGADLLYLDGQYLEAEYQGRAGIMGDPPSPRRGWGHSTVEACVATAVAAGVRELHLGHREPKRTDEDLARIQAYAERSLCEALQRGGRQANTCRVQIPHEGLTVRL
jgi:phosphoribosyl 1,2-cyclic phosphodiesterase